MSCEHDAGDDAREELEVWGMIPGAKLEVGIGAKLELDHQSQEEWGMDGYYTFVELYVEYHGKTIEISFLDLRQANQQRFSDFATDELPANCYLA